jgi:hypothetical protein
LVTSTARVNALFFLSFSPFESKTVVSVKYSNCVVDGCSDVLLVDVVVVADVVVVVVEVVVVVVVDDFVEKIFAGWSTLKQSGLAPCQEHFSPKQRHWITFDLSLLFEQNLKQSDPLSSPFEQATLSSSIHCSAAHLSEFAAAATLERSWIALLESWLKAKKEKSFISQKVFRIL